VLAGALVYVPHADTVVVIEGKLHGRRVGRVFLGRQKPQRSQSAGTSNAWYDCGAAMRIAQHGQSHQHISQTSPKQQGAIHGSLAKQKWQRCPPRTCSQWLLSVNKLSWVLEGTAMEHELGLPAPYPHCTVDPGQRKCIIASMTANVSHRRNVPKNQPAKKKAPF
jgi:hypothetical protein